VCGSLDGGQEKVIIVAASLSSFQTNGARFEENQMSCLHDVWKVFAVIQIPEEEHTSHIKLQSTRSTFGRLDTHNVANCHLTNLWRFNGA
jgi:hypothetical protein